MEKELYEEMPKEDGEIEIDLLGLLLRLRKFWFVILLGIVLGASVAWSYTTMCVTPQYQASSMVYMRGANQTTNAAASLQELQVNTELTNDYEVIFKSRPIMEKVVKELDLKMTYKQLAARVQISNITNTRILKVSIQDEDPKLARDIVNHVVSFGMDSAVEIDSKLPYLIEGAVEDLDKVAPNMKMNVLIGGCIGCLLIAGGVVVQYLLNSNITSSDDVERYLELPVLCEISEDDSFHYLNKGKYKHKRWRRRQEEESVRIPGFMISLPQVELKASVMESYKILRTYLLNTEAKTLAVTSTLPDEGKTVTAYHLALSFAQAGKKTLLMDCDLRKSKLYSYLHVERNLPGISEYLSKQSGITMYQTTLPNLSLMFSGKHSPNPTELLSDERFELLLRMLKEQYDYIIIDTPPVNRAADASIVGKCVDGIVCVVRSDYVKKKFVEKSKKMIQRNGGHLIGVVLNRLDVHQSSFYRNNREND